MKAIIIGMIIYMSPGDTCYIYQTNFNQEIECVSPTYTAGDSIFINHLNINQCEDKVTF